MAGTPRQVIEDGQATLIAKRVHRLERPSQPEARSPLAVGAIVRALSRCVSGQLHVRPKLGFQVAVLPAVRDGSP